MSSSRIFFVQLLSALLLFGFGAVQEVQGVGLNQWFKSHPGKKFWGFVGDINVVRAGQTDVGFTNFGSVASFKDLWVNTTTRNEFDTAVDVAYQLQAGFSPTIGIVYATQGKWGLTGNPIVSPEGIPAWLDTYNNTVLNEWYNQYVNIIALSYTAWSPPANASYGYESGFIVVEKPLASDGTLRPSLWSKRFGESYIHQAYASASLTKYPTDPRTFQISEEGLLGNSKKLEAFIALVGRINKDKKVVEVVNVLVTSADTTSGPSPLQTLISTLSSRTGLEIRLMASNKYAITNPNDWLVVAQACVGAKACTAVYSFGICDDKTFSATSLNITNALFDSNCQPKPVVAKILALP